MKKYLGLEGSWQTAYRRNKEGMYNQEVFNNNQKICTVAWCGEEYENDNQKGQISRSEETAKLISKAYELFSMAESLVKSYFSYDNEEAIRAAVYGFSIILDEITNRKDTIRNNKIYTKRED